MSIQIKSGVKFVVRHGANPPHKCEIVGLNHIDQPNPNSVPIPIWDYNYQKQGSNEVLTAQIDEPALLKILSNQ